MTDSEIVIVESTVWIDYLEDVRNAHTIWLDEHLPYREIALTDLIFCEVLQGYRREKEFQRVLRDLSEFEVFSMGGSGLALEAAKNYRFLRARGITIRTTIDCLIATFCIRNGYTLLHHDRDYDPFEQHLGLLTVHPGEPTLQ